MKRQFRACQTPRSMYPCIFNSFRVIRCLSQCVSPKIAIFTTFWFLWGRPWGNQSKCCMDGKRIRCLSRLMFPSNYNRFSDRAIYWSKIVIFHAPLHSTPPLWGFPSEYHHPVWCGKTRMVWLPDGVKISNISLFVLAQLTNVTDRRTDGRTPHADIYRAYAYASRGKND